MLRVWDRGNHEANYQNLPLFKFGGSEEGDVGNEVVLKAENKFLD